MSFHTTVKVTNPERAAEWTSVLGSDTIAVTGPLPQRGHLPGKPDAMVYSVDLKALTVDQKRALISHLADKFDLDWRYVQESIDEFGVPILAEDCVMVTDMPLHLMLD